MGVKKMVPLIECDFCCREQLDPPASWKTFDLALETVRWRPVVSLCPDCTRVPFADVVARLEAIAGGEPADANS